MVGLDHDTKLLVYTGVLMVMGVAVGVLRKKEGVLNAYLQLISFLLPTITRLVFSSFPCLELDTGERWLLADKSIDCDGAAHVVMVAYVRERSE